MATFSEKLKNCNLFIFIFLSILIFIECSSVFEHLVGNPNPCEEVCKRTYPQHTYDKVNHQIYCNRGCRLFSIIEFVKGDEDLNKTVKMCGDSCGESYPAADDKAACLTGCSSQRPFAEKRKEIEMHSEKQNIHLMYPFMLVHRMYSNMMDQISHHVSVSWSYYMQADNGNIIIVQSQPRYIVETHRSNGFSDFKTSNYLESNIRGIDNSATPNLKSSQVHPRFNGINYMKSEEKPNDWLDCISRKTGLPRLFLGLVIFMSAMVMIWLCLTTIATAPEQRVPQQKLSIYGDLEYLAEMDEKLIMQKIHPQNMVEAGPLPIKLAVEKI